MMRVIFFGLLVAAGLDGLSATAASLDLQTQKPDLSAGFLNTTYDAATGKIIVSGWPISFNVNGTSKPDYPFIYGGQYELNAQLTPAGQPLAGTLHISGTIPGLASSGTLLTGQLSQFGFQDSGGNIFEFVFDVTGGDLAPYYRGEIGVALDSWNSGFGGSFVNNFAASPFLGVADNAFLVPEPPTITLLAGTMVIGLLIWKLRRLRTVVG
jgi:hypothetical protein